YVERPAPLAALPPGLIEGAHLAVFGLEGSVAAIDACCDRYLNPAAQGVLRYRAVLPTVLVSMLRARKLVSTSLPYRWVAEQECAAWVLLAATTQDGNQTRMERLVWWMPYVWVDTTVAMVTGRDVWGFPKDIGWFELPAADTDPGRYVVSTRIYPQLGPE